MITTLTHRLAALIAREAPSYPPATRRRALAEVARARALLARPEITLRGPTMKNPFQPHDVTVADRLQRLRTFNEQQCQDALALHGLGSLSLQKTVVQALQSRLRRIGVAA